MVFIYILYPILRPFDRQKMHINRIIRLNMMILLPSTLSSTDMFQIWRTWEDCFYLQAMLEDELARGKGIRPTGNAAAYLDPSLAIHIPDIDALPRLNKKGVLFVPSTATVAQRSSEYHALVNALLDNGLLAVLCKLRDDRLIHDFFGYWRRDYDLAKKTGPFVSMS
jgi:hypothetical protein